MRILFAYFQKSNYLYTIKLKQQRYDFTFYQEDFRH